MQPLPTTGAATMRPIRRQPVNKRRSAKQFKRNVRKTKAANGWMRGGIRL